jgi:phosphoribosyl 1,2-cyclic phosphate phosphodiesterase
VQVVVLGSGTSHGVPIIGCRCPVCISTDPRNRRLRTSALVRLGAKNLLIDTTPDLRQQAIRAGLDRVDAVVYTHSHADHVMGFDELRRFSELALRATPVYASRATLATLFNIFHYAITDDTYGFFGIPVVDWRPLDGPVEIDGHRLAGVPLVHGEHLATGVRIEAPDGTTMAWCPDCCGVPEASRELLRGLDMLFLDGLRHRPHPTHFTVAQAMETIRGLAPRQAWLIHMTHDLDHATTEAALPAMPEVPGGVRLAYDGLVVDVGRG